MTKYQYQLVWQWPTPTMRDYDAMVSAENALIDRLSSVSQLDGHDFGSEGMNIFILKNDPEKAFTEAKAVLDRRELGKDVRAAYCMIDESEYKILWPQGLKAIEVI